IIRHLDSVKCALCLIEKKYQKRALETTEEYEVRFAYNCNRKQKTKALETNEQYKESLKCQHTYYEKNNQNSKSFKINLNQNNNLQKGCSQNQNSMNTAATNNDEISAIDLNELDRDQLKKFQNKIDKLKYNLCPVPEELKGLTEIKEILIAQVFPVMSVYRFRRDQLGYYDNIINFPQN
ncbi:29556_t:CDS:2, partial [Gigaspora margarita]